MPSLRELGQWTLVVSGVTLLALTALSLFPGSAWFVRALDLIREPAVYLALFLAAVAMLSGRWRSWLVSGFLLVAALNLARIWPYVSVAPTELPLLIAPKAHCFTALSLNVKMENDQYDRVVKLIAHERPDMLLLMETDGRWASALEHSLAPYSYRLSMPLDNAYGMIFASNLRVRDARMVANTSANTPTLYATIEARTGNQIAFIGLHPRPPLPGQDTAKRDANIARAGARAPDAQTDGLVMGDFNDVPWSRTTSQFRDQGQWLDPRTGRGSYPTFPAPFAFAGWPLDQVMVRGSLRVAAFDRLDDVGSDHLPMRAVVCGSESTAPSR